MYRCTEKSALGKNTELPCSVPLKFSLLIALNAQAQVLMNPLHISMDYMEHFGIMVGQALLGEHHLHLSQGFDPAGQVALDSLQFMQK